MTPPARVPGQLHLAKCDEPRVVVAHAAQRALGSCPHARRVIAAYATLQALGSRPHARRVVVAHAAQQALRACRRVVAVFVLLALFDPSSALAQSADANETSALRDLERFEEEPAAADSGKPRTPITQASLEQLLRAYGAEPKVEQVVAAALEAAKHDPAKYAAMASRARLRALLPHIDLGARRGQGIDLRWTPTEDLEAHRTTADDVTLFATMRFDLDRLIFSGEEVSIAREARSAKNAEHQLIRAVVHVYFLRRRLMLERDMLAGSSIAQQLRIQEAEALLDAFTGGAFQRMLKDSKSKAWRTGASTNASERR